ncbi:GNAT family N-acetyltransferase [Streptomyces bauhiniae]
MAQIDPRVAPAAPLSGDQVLAVSSGNGAGAVGMIQEHRFDEDTYDALWGALRRHVLQVRVFGPDSAAAFDEVLTGLLDRLGAETAGPDADQAVLLTWPSLDTACAAPLVRHGFAPLTSLVFKRLGQRTEPSSAVTVRPAQADDLGWLVERAELLHLFENELGVLPRRAALRTLLAEELAKALADESSFVLIALTDGRPTGFVQGQFPHGAWIEQQVAVEQTGYLSRMFVDPEARRKSVGRALIVAAHEVLRARSVRAVLLHHSLHSPFATPLWARWGYRPVLTTWTKHRCGAEWA